MADESIENPDVTPELQAEFDAWERASDEAWALIADWERQDE